MGPKSKAAARAKSAPVAKAVPAPPPESTPVTLEDARKALLDMSVAGKEEREELPKVVDALRHFLDADDVADWTVEELLALDPFCISKDAAAKILGLLAPPPRAELVKATTPAKVRARPAPPQTAAKAKLPPKASALAQFLRCAATMRMESKPDPFPMRAPKIHVQELESRLKQAQMHNLSVLLCCPHKSTYKAIIRLLRDLSLTSECDLERLHVAIYVEKRMSVDDACEEAAKLYKQAVMDDCIFLVALGPQIDVTKYLTMDKFVEEEAGFLVVYIANAGLDFENKIPNNDALAVIEVLPIVDLPAELPLSRRALRALLRTRTVEATNPAASTAWVYDERFEFITDFSTPQWEEKWKHGPNTTDHNGKPIKPTLLHRNNVKYPSHPKDAKQCMELIGGLPNVHCTGIYATFSPLIRPTIVEFEFTLQGRFDVANACVVFTQYQFDGILPDTRVGLQFCVRGGMVLAAGGGNVVRISNDGKIQHDKWQKVRIQIDWDRKVMVGQVDSQGKGYTIGVQTCPFRDAACEGFGAVYIFNQESMGTSWWHSMRIIQDPDTSQMDTTALDARAELAKNIEQRGYQRAVDDDMKVGMVMGAISETKSSGMNLAEEQRANYGSAAAAHR